MIITQHIIFLPLLVLTYQDLKDMKISLIAFSTFFGLSFLGTYHLCAIFIFALSWTIWMISRGMAVADIFILAGSAHFVPPEKIGIFLIVIGISGTIFGLFSRFVLKKPEFPMIPSIFIALLFVTFTNLISF